MNLSNREKMLELMKANHTIAKDFFNMILDIDDTNDSSYKVNRSHMTSITYRESVPLK